MTRTDFGNALPGLEFDTSYARLPERFYAQIHAREFSRPSLVKLNEPLAAELGMALDAVNPDELALVFSGQDPKGESKLLAMAYSGHQFGHFNPGLGDGRAGLVGEVVDTKGQRRDIQLKGSGPTPFSRNGDGLAALGPVMREYIVAEAMHALGVPTTRSLAITLTGDRVWREIPVPGAVLTRVAASHLRVGTFQHFAARQDLEGVRALFNYALERHYPELKEAKNAPLEFLNAVIERQAKLVAQWMGLGFIHGVMNTDNMTISGETIDYGPCAFMDLYDHGKVYSSIDQQGRYAFGNQPQMAQWNLARLAETLVPLMGQDEDAAIEMATQAVRDFGPKFSHAWREVFSAKLGLANNDGAVEIIRNLLALMQQHNTDFTNTFVMLTDSVEAGFKKGDLAFAFRGDDAFDAWFENWRKAVSANDSTMGAKMALEAMRNANPVYIPRNHLVEEAIRAGEDKGDFAPMEKLLEAVLNPFERHEGFESFAQPPAPEQEVLQTFCGT